MHSSGQTIHPLIRTLAMATCVVALLPISMGALVTTLKAGMAFADWPSSDGQNMLTYPWFSDFANDTDKFVEHGHRLAGMLIGLVSVALAVSAWIYGAGWVRTYATLILVAVIGQGLLGGARVLLDRQILAMLHSITGSLFFSMCVVFRVLCSTSWPRWKSVAEERLSPLGVALIFAATVALGGQYVLGGLLRHLHLMLNEHLIGAAVAGTFSLAAAFCLLRSGHPLLRRAGVGLVSTLTFQVLLGFGAYLTRFGLPIVGYVATTGSLSQAVICSLHTVCGMALLASSVVSTVAIVHLMRAGCLKGLNFSIDVGSAADRGKAV